MDINHCNLIPLNIKYASEISTWQYDAPYEAYSFRDNDGYLWNKNSWGSEQFCMLYENMVLGQVACQFDNNEMWVGWSLNPDFCGKGIGSDFIKQCVEELCRVKNYKKGYIYLRVAAWNKRAIKCYQKIGFEYINTILDEIAGTDKQEEFWVMRKSISVINEQ
ncbi:MAG: GNAT family N-acetyltransferase [Clostridiales bacterium]|nr:GNAT family N-acetyltransferase [Clostridiales bacterium]